MKLKRTGQGHRSSAAAILIGLIAFAPMLAQDTQSEPDAIRIGFTRGIFKNRNENDVLAAMKVWAQTIGQQRGIEVSPDIVIYPSLGSATEAVDSGTVDAITLLLTEYSEFPDGLLSGPLFRDEEGGSTHVEFVLVGAQGGKVSGVEQLSGAKLTIHNNVESVLAMEWLEAQCAKAGVGPLSTTVASMDHNDKLSGAVLSVFFGKSDACLVTRFAFNSMVELNPQVGVKLVPVAISPPVITSLFAFRRALPKAQKTKLFTEVQRLHESVTGEQVLRVFKSERMTEVTTEDMADSLTLLRQWRQAVQGEGESSSTGERGKE